METEWLPVSFIVTSILNAVSTVCKIDAACRLNVAALREFAATPYEPYRARDENGRLALSLASVYGSFH